MKNRSRVMRAAASIAMLFLTVITTLTTSVKSALAVNNATLVAITALSAPVSGGGRLFWVDNRYTAPAFPAPPPEGESRFRAGSSIYGYNLQTQSEFLVTTSVDDKRSLATDGSILAWVEEYAPTLSAPPTSVIKTYNIVTGAISTLVTAPNAELSGVALDQGVLYYVDNTPGYTGLYARYLSGPMQGNEMLVTTSANDNRIVVSQGRILWTDQQSTYSEGTLRPDGGDEGTSLFKTYRVMTTTLHLSTLDGSISDRIVASEQGCLTGYDRGLLRGVYSFSCGALDERAHEYNVSTSTSTALSTAAATYPLVSGNTVVWTKVPTGEVGETKAWSVLKYDIATAATMDTVGASSAETRAEVIVDSNTLALSVAEDASREGVSLYLTSLIIPPAGQGVTTFQDQTPAPSISSSCDRSRPSSCGQVRRYGAFFIDDGGYWPMNGVQFILPQAGSGLSDQTFFATTYINAVNDGTHCAHNQYIPNPPNPNIRPCSLEYWLYQAQTNLLAKTLRIIVDAENANTCFWCIQDFAERANVRGMRLGVVVRNSTAQIGPTNRAFLDSFFSYFTTASGHANKIAYMSIDNEINNHLGTGFCPRQVTVNGQVIEIKDAQGRYIDCYDRYVRPANQGGDPYRTYINKAAMWARDFNRKWRAAGSTILRTVGLSTEMGDWDYIDVMNDFFRWPRLDDPNIPQDQRWGLVRLVDNVDFLSPHRYNGDVLPLQDRARLTLHYYDPLMLEEFGWPTDPYNGGANSSFKDGDQNLCRYDPLGNSLYCRFTAPYIVELSTRRVRASGPLGFAGMSSWMMADIDGANCSSASDVFTGLFTAGATYCGGTHNPYPAYAKNSAFRVRTHHFYFNPHP